MDMTTKTYRDFEIIPWSDGFEKYFAHKSSGGSMDKFEFGIIAKFIVKKESEVMGFAFAVAGLDIFAEPRAEKFKDENLINKAMEKIKRYLDNQKFSHNEELTFEFQSQDFFNVQNPIWWENN